MSRIVQILAVLIIVCALPSVSLAGKGNITPFSEEVIKRAKEFLGKPCPTIQPFSFSDFKAYVEKNRHAMEWIDSDAKVSEGTINECLTYDTCMKETVWEYSDFYKMTKQEYCAFQCNQAASSTTRKNEKSQKAYAQARSTHTLQAYREFVNRGIKGPEMAKAKLIIAYAETYNDTVLRNLSEYYDAYYSYKWGTGRMYGYSNAHMINYSLSSLPGSRLSIDVSGKIGVELSRQTTWQGWTSWDHFMDVQISHRDIKIKVTGMAAVYPSGRGTDVKERKYIQFKGILETDPQLPTSHYKVQYHSLEGTFKLHKIDPSIYIGHPIWGKGKKGEFGEVNIATLWADPIGPCGDSFVERFIQNDERLPELPASMNF